MKQFFTIAVLVLGIGTGSLSAQEEESEEKSNTRPAQVCFVYPIGSNGMESPKYTNGFSLNILAGYNGGVNGIEIGGFANILKGNMTGVQIAGFCNVNNGSAIGTQIAGFTNVNNGSVTGTQIAGFANVNKSITKGAQISGFANYAGIGSGCTQIGGFANLSFGSVKGAQIAGFFNLCKKKSTGAQIAGFANLAAAYFSGVQISGFFNFAKRLRGVQIGFINICDTIEKGVPIGFLSIVKHGGYYALELGVDESLHTKLGLKLGTRKLYSHIFMGGKAAQEEMLWGYGYGLGTIISLSQKFDLNIEGSAYHINHGSWWTRKVNMINKIQLNLAYRMTDKFSVYGGPSYNVYVSNDLDIDGNLPETINVKWSHREYGHNNTIVQQYVGFTAGLRYEF